MGLVAAVTTVAVAVINLPPLFTGQMLADNLQRPEDIPSYWQQDADYLAVRGRHEPRARAAGRGLRVVPMGEHRRPDHAGLDGPAVRRP